MMVRATGLALACALVAAPLAHAADPSIVGFWYEEPHYDGARVISVSDFRADGTYRFLFRRCVDRGGEENAVETGHWTYVNGRLKTVPDIATMATNEYQTDLFDGRVWEYHHVAGYMFNVDGPIKFRDIRVQPGAKLPTCDATS